MNPSWYDYRLIFLLFRLPCSLFWTKHAMSCAKCLNRFTLENFCRLLSLSLFCNDVLLGSCTQVMISFPFQKTGIKTRKQSTCIDKFFLWTTVSAACRETQTRRERRCAASVHHMYTAWKHLKSKTWCGTPQKEQRISLHHLMLIQNWIGPFCAFCIPFEFILRHSAASPMFHFVDSKLLDHVSKV